jgi:hypothetical protein
MLPDYSEQGLNEAVLLPLIHELKSRDDVYVGEDEKGHFVAFLAHSDLDRYASREEKLFGRGATEEEAVTELAVRYMMLRRMDDVLNEMEQTITTPLQDSLWTASAPVKKTKSPKKVIISRAQPA